MTMQNPFVPDAGVQKPGIVGARWWNQRLDESANLQGRRAALTTALVVGGGVAMLGALVVWGASSDSDDDARAEWKTSLEVQRDYGWNFGVPSETVAFDQAFTQTYARDALATLEKDLAPTNPAHQAFYVPSLFQSPEALPRKTMEGQTQRIAPLADALRPIRTPAMDRLFAIGEAYAELVASFRVATVIDLDGPSAVAFAAGAARRLDPIFLFDNWPHPKGVVPAHLTLAAATYYQPVFQKAATTRSQSAPPAFVLDRARLRAYTDDATQFDNRYLAKLPSKLAEPLVLLVIGDDTTDLPESTDLTRALHALGDPRVLATTAFRAPPGEGVLFGGTPEAQASFAERYRSRTSGQPPVAGNERAERYQVPVAPLSDPPTGGAPGIGYVPVVVALGTGLVIGSRFNRSGSWNRAYSDDGYSSSGG
jgi:hypothetical protein